ncbi:hypothetical protein F4780DRAFT_745194 [Xylariomycetidae sp. FL0641]|nr:hypothetical protein F4780DRAFT_745194 [Xylariomycetidae sp. FL0641]
MEGTANQYPVYLGFWTNWSHGRIMGATLTLKREDANLLIAFTGFIIAFVAARVWRILCFTFHTLTSTSKPRAAIYHQRQAILRNASTPEDGITLLLDLVWANRRSRKTHRLREIYRSLWAVVLATVCLSAFIIAGGFSSRISTVSDNEVIMKSARCGTVYSDPLEWDPQLLLRSEMVQNAAAYASRCYSKSSSKSPECWGFVVSKISPSLLDNKAICPFEVDMCRVKEENILIDSGFLDSRKHFGLNAPSDHRIQWRNVLHCAPLVTAGFTHQTRSPIYNSTQYRYGSIATPNCDLGYVYSAKSLETQYADWDSSNTTMALGEPSLEIFKATVENGSFYKGGSNFCPVPDVSRTDADTYLIFLESNGLIFAEASDDPWYDLSKHTSHAPDGTGLSQSYRPSEPSSPLGCVEKHQFCSINTDGVRECGPLASIRDAVKGASPLFNATYDYDNTGAKIATTESAALFNYFVDTISSNHVSVFTIIQTLGAASLDSRRYLYNGIQTKLEPRQWQLDVVHWWNMVMAGRQQGFLDAAYGSSDPAYPQRNEVYESAVYQKLCKSEKIRSTRYASFNLFGLLFIAIAGLLLVLVSYLLEPISRYLHRRGYKQYAYLEWTTNSTLQLQRLAHEELGLGTWSGCTEAIPVTDGAALLGCLDITDPAHPVITSIDSLQDLGEAPNSSSDRAGPQAESTATLAVNSNETPEASEMLFKPPRNGYDSMEGSGTRDSQETLRSWQPT